MKHIVNSTALPLPAGMLVAVLWVLVVGSALAVVNSTHQVRKQVDRLEVLRREAAETQVEWGRYLLEQSSLAAYGRVERAAVTELNMQVPGAEQIVVVQP